MLVIVLKNVQLSQFQSSITSGETKFVNKSSRLVKFLFSTIKERLSKDSCDIGVYMILN